MKGTDKGRNPAHSYEVPDEQSFGRSGIWYVEGSEGCRGLRPKVEKEPEGQAERAVSIVSVMDLHEGARGPQPSRDRYQWVNQPSGGDSWRIML
jgi:hypothetical protein